MMLDARKRFCLALGLLTFLLFTAFRRQADEISTVPVWGTSESVTRPQAEDVAAPPPDWKTGTIPVEDPSKLSQHLEEEYPSFPSLAQPSITAPEEQASTTAHYDNVYDEKIVSGFEQFEKHLQWEQEHLYLLEERDRAETALNETYDPDDRIYHQFPEEQHLFASISELERTKGEKSPNLHDNAKLRNMGPSLKVYDPYPDYDSSAYKQKYDGDYVSCIGPRGVRLNESFEDWVTAYEGMSKSFPQPTMGSFDLLGLDSDVCFDRFGRFGPYGYVGDDETRAVTGWRKPSSVQWDNVEWGKLQHQCLKLNKNRFDMNARDPLRPVLAEETLSSTSSASGTGISKRQRTAVLIRTMATFAYLDNVKHNIRAIIQELSLMSGGEYEVFLVVQVRDENIPIFSDDMVYKATLEEAVPPEFQDMTILWNENLMQLWYPQIKDHWHIFESQWMPVQWFAQTHPEFDFYWNFEMDARYTGHWYHLLESLGDWAKKQPRKGIWERSERFYIPDYHGDYYTNFTGMVERRDKDLVWGAVPVKDERIIPLGPTPPSSDPSQDSHKWGVGEDADLITLLPMFDPTHSGYALKGDVFNYVQGEFTPRRTTIVTMYRVSKALLDIMHHENTHSGHGMGSEQWPLGAALQHGLKAVYAPHPLFFDRQWKGQDLNMVFNPGPRGTSGETMKSPFGTFNEHNFIGGTWYYRADSAAMLYRRWLGWETTGVGGEEWEGIHGRFCLPGIMLHPIKAMLPPGSKQELGWEQGG